MILSEDTKQKIRLKALGHKRNVGRRLSEETKEKLRRKATGRLHTDATKERIRQRKKGIPLSNSHRTRMCAVAAKIVKCPNCDKIGKGAGMRKNHFRNCKELKHVGKPKTD